ncbi:MAG: HAMP domain-containing protein, partial [Polyangiaceae bacterium]|nr:HAMP domain-containing protein [Polyangiaceae bacterium]
MGTAAPHPEKGRPSRKARSTRPPARSATRDDSEELRSLRDALRAAASGDRSVRLPTDGTSSVLIGELALAFNALNERHESFVTELSRVAKRVSTEGDISARAELGGVAGAWQSGIDSVNELLDAMAWPLAETTRVLELVAEGDLTREMALHVDGRPLEGDVLHLGQSVSSLVTRLRHVSSRVSRVAREMGIEGKLGVQADLEGLSGTWKSLVSDMNLLSNNLTAQVRSIAVVSSAVANGDLSQTITVDTRGELFELKNAINALVDRLRSFAAEVIRVAREVGTEGKLGAQADVRGVSGVWQELTDSVNHLASNLTSQVRNIAQIATAIANGDLSQKITVDAKGEILELKNTLNAMVDQLRTFAGEVTRVAREVGTEGKLGGIA